MVTAELIESLEIELKDAQNRLPYEDGSVKEVTCKGVLEYLSGKKRAWLLEEIYRVLIPQGTCTVMTLYWSSSMAYHDYRLEWPPVVEQSFLMFNKEWREREKKDVELNCDFDFTYGFVWDAETATRNVETQAFHAKHYLNSVATLQVVLTKR